MAYNRQQYTMKKMNLMLTVLAVLAVFGLTSCNKTEKKIIGTWEPTSVTLIESSTPVSEGDDDPTAEIKGTTWTFNSDNTCSVSGTDDEGNAQTMNGTYTVKGDDVVMTFTMSEAGLSATATFDIDIESISKTEMTVDGKETISFPAFGMEEWVKFKASFTKK